MQKGTKSSWKPREVRITENLLHVTETYLNLTSHSFGQRRAPHRLLTV